MSWWTYVHFSYQTWENLWLNRQSLNIYLNKIKLTPPNLTKNPLLLPLRQLYKRHCSFSFIRLVTFAMKHYFLISKVFRKINSFTKCWVSSWSCKSQVPLKQKYNGLFCNETNILPLLWIFEVVQDKPSRLLKTQNRRGQRKHFYCTDSGRRSPQSRTIP